MTTICFNKFNLKLDELNQILSNEGIIGFPTETVYGLGAFISKEKALKKIYELKGRPREKAFIVHLGDLSQVELVAENIPEEFYLLAKAFLPGPLTIVLKKKASLSTWVSSLDTIAIRMSSHPLTLKILKGLKEPIVGTSANISFEKNLVTAKEVLKTFQDKIDCLIDGGECSIGIPSTIISLVDQIKILRKGTVSQKQIEQVLQKKIFSI